MMLSETASSPGANRATVDIDSSPVASRPLSSTNALDKFSPCFNGTIKLNRHSVSCRHCSLSTVRVFTTDAAPSVLTTRSCTHSMFVTTTRRAETIRTRHFLRATSARCRLVLLPSHIAQVGLLPN